MSTTPSTAVPSSTATALTWASLIVACAGTAGSLYLSLGMDLVPCPLCYYERTFVMAAAGTLLLGLLGGAGRVVSLAGLALPLAVAGAAVAGLHVWLEATGKLECPPGVGGVGSAPQQSLAALAALTLLLALAAFPSRLLGGGALVSLAGCVVGGAMAYGCIVSAPKPTLPTKPHPKEIKGCRPPYGEKVQFLPRVLGLTAYPSSRLSESGVEEMGRIRLYSLV